MHRHRQSKNGVKLSEDKQAELDAVVRKNSVRGS